MFCTKCELSYMWHKTESTRSESLYFITVTRAVWQFSTYIIELSDLYRVGRAQLYRLSFFDVHTVAANQYTKNNWQFSPFLSWHCAMCKSVNCHTCDTKLKQHWENYCIVPVFMNILKLLDLYRFGGARLYRLSLVDAHTVAVLTREKSQHFYSLYMALCYVQKCVLSFNFLFMTQHRIHTAWEYAKQDCVWYDLVLVKAPTLYSSK